KDKKEKYDFYLKGEEGFILTNKGTKVPVFKVTSETIYARVYEVTTDVNGKVTETLVDNARAMAGLPTVITEYNCVGNAMCSQNFVISIENISQKIIEEEGFADVSGSAQHGDIGIYFSDGEFTVGNSGKKVTVPKGQAVHMESIVGNIYSNIVYANSKGGIEANIELIKPGTERYHSRNTRYALMRRTTQNIEVLSEDFEGPLSPNQVRISSGVVETGTNLQYLGTVGVNTVPAETFESIRDAVLDKP
ncbi:MAG: hypothetical protein JNL32_14495, partial [Candidatus Kapabacteria bacterium]|nr:hypothetical protein [Candidatus Kapabacteria bacterium]